MGIEIQQMTTTPPDGSTSSTSLSSEEQIAALRTELSELKQRVAQLETPPSIPHHLLRGFSLFPAHKFITANDLHTFMHESAILHPIMEWLQPICAITLFAMQSIHCIKQKNSSVSARDQAFYTKLLAASLLIIAIKSAELVGHSLPPIAELIVQLSLIPMTALYMDVPIEEYITELRHQLPHAKVN